MKCIFRETSLLDLSTLFCEPSTVVLL